VRPHGLAAPSGGAQFGAEPASPNSPNHLDQRATLMSHLDVHDSKLSRIVSDEPMAKRASEFRFTEGPVWRAKDGVLIFGDIPDDRLYSFDPRADAVEIFRAPSSKTNGNCLNRPAHQL
jgi:hypothetical protein